MARNKPYTLGLAIIDTILTLLTGGFWMLIILIRELYRHPARKKPYTIGLAILDVILTPLTGGFWLLIMLIRELYRRS